MGLPVTSGRKVGMTSNHHALYDLGYTRATMGGTESSEVARRSESHKATLSSDCSLQLDCMKSELLVIAHQHVAVNTFSGLVHTAHQGTGVAFARSLSLSGPKVRAATRLKL